MLTTRKIKDGEFLKNKERSWDKKEKLTKWHEAWSTVQNQHLSKCGYDVRVDHRSYADRGVDIEPQIHMGPIKYIEDTDLDRVKEYNRIASENGKRIIENPGIAINELTHHQAYFTETDILKMSHRYSVDAEQYEKVKSSIGFSPELVTLGKNESGETCFTSREMLTAEREMFEKTDRLFSNEKHQVHKKYLQQAISTRTLSPEQETALNHVATGKDVSVIVGHAGTGKSYMLDAVREAYESQGYKISGVALS
jgi:ATP-dependent exoDNAse (exonuclease V) alpha subunit